MEPKIGLWIDQKKAVVVSISDKGKEINTLDSGVENYFQHSTGNCSNSDFGRKDLPAYDIMERDLEMHIMKFYDKVISFIRNAGRIFIFGPGEIKTGLKKRIETKRYMTRNIKIETADKMTDKEILDKVRRHYSPKIVDNVYYGRYVQSAGR